MQDTEAHRLLSALEDNTDGNVYASGWGDHPVGQCDGSCDRILKMLQDAVGPMAEHQHEWRMVPTRSAPQSSILLRYCIWCDHVEPVQWDWV